VPKHARRKTKPSMPSATTNAAETQRQSDILIQAQTKSSDIIFYRSYPKFMTNEEVQTCKLRVQELRAQMQEGFRQCADEFLRSPGRASASRENSEQTMKK